MTDDPKPDAPVTFTGDRDTPESLDDVFARPEVAAITPRREEPLPSERTSRQPERMQEDAPAFHSDTVWGGPCFVTNAEDQPVWVETKAEYWALLRKNRLHMRDQQESTTGDGPPPPAPPTPLHLTPHPGVAPLTKHEAEVFGAMTAVLKKYDLVESVWCTHCFTRGVPHGCRVVVNARVVHVECRGGLAQWTTPVGETNLVLQTLAQTAGSRATDYAPGTITTAAGPVMRPARILSAEECVIIRTYLRLLTRRGLEPRWHHRACWSGNPWHEDDALALQVSDDQIVGVCACRQLFARTVALVTH